MSSYMIAEAFGHFEARPDPLADTDGAVVLYYLRGSGGEVARWHLTASEAADLAVALLGALPVALRNERLLALPV